MFLDGESLINQNLLYSLLLPFKYVYYKISNRSKSNYNYKLKKHSQ